MLCWTSSKMEASDWLKFVCYKYLAATTSLYKTLLKENINVKISCSILLSLPGLKKIHFAAAYQMEIHRFLLKYYVLILDLEQISAKSVEWKIIFKGSSKVNLIKLKLQSCIPQHFAHSSQEWELDRLESWNLELDKNKRIQSLWIQIDVEQMAFAFYFQAYLDIFLCSEIQFLCSLWLLQPYMQPPMALPFDLCLWTMSLHFCKNSFEDSMSTTE